MSKYVQQSEEMKNALNLEWSPIAITFSDAPHPDGTTKKQVGVCKSFDNVLLKGEIINLSKENLLCLGALVYMGFRPMPLSVGAIIWVDYHKGLASHSIAKRKMMLDPKAPGILPWTKKLQKPYVIISPLEKVEHDPSVVLVFGIPEQADRFTGLLAFHGHRPMPYYPASSICYSAMTPYVTGKTTMSLISQHGREMFDLKIPPTHMFVSTPYKNFEQAVNDLPHSGYGNAETKKLSIKIMNDLVK